MKIMEMVAPPHDLHPLCNCTGCSPEQPHKQPHPHPPCPAPSLIPSDPPPLCGCSLCSPDECMQRWDTVNSFLSPSSSSDSSSSSSSSSSLFSSTVTSTWTPPSVSHWSESSRPPVPPISSSSSRQHPVSHSPQPSRPSSLLSRLPEPRRQLASHPPQASQLPASRTAESTSSWRPVASNLHCYPSPSQLPVSHSAESTSSWRPAASNLRYSSPDLVSHVSGASSPYYPTGAASCVPDSSTSSFSNFSQSSPSPSFSIAPAPKPSSSSSSPSPSSPYSSVSHNVSAFTFPSLSLSSFDAMAESKYTQTMLHDNDDEIHETMHKCQTTSRVNQDKFVMVFTLVLRCFMVMVLILPPLLPGPLPHLPIGLLLLVPIGIFSALLYCAFVLPSLPKQSQTTFGSSNLT